MPMMFEVGQKIIEEIQQYLYSGIVQKKHGEILAKEMFPQLRN